MPIMFHAHFAPCRLCSTPVIYNACYAPNLLSPCRLCPMAVVLHICYAPCSLYSMPIMLFDYVLCPLWTITNKFCAKYSPYLLCLMPIISQDHYNPCPLCPMPITPHTQYASCPLRFILVMPHAHYAPCPLCFMTIGSHAHCAPYLLCSLCPSIPKSIKAHDN